MANKKKTVEALAIFDGHKNILNKLTMSNNTPNPYKFQYECSFCWRELPNDSIRFNGIGACPVHFALAQKLVNGLNKHRREYSAKFGGAK